MAVVNFKNVPSKIIIMSKPMSIKPAVANETANTKPLAEVKTKTKSKKK